MKLTQAQARHYLLRHQNLLPPRAASGKDAILAHMRRVGSVQFDPLDVVGCNPHLVMQSRFKGYRPSQLNDLLYKDRLLIDGFDKQLSIWPAEDWPCFTRDRNSSDHWWEMGDPLLLGTQKHVLEEVAARGALCSADFETRDKVRWPWGPTNAVRAALESLYFRGDLVVHHKTGTRKYYDLSSRHINPDLLSAPDPNPIDGDYIQWRVLRRVGSIGLVWNRAGDAWLGIGLKAAQRAEAIAGLEARGLLTRLEVEGIGHPFLVRSRDLPELEECAATDGPAPAMAFLAPLDNLIWDRRLIEALFGFEYRWEVYTPPPQRKFGWYVLPVLYGDRLIARVEPKFNKKEKTLELVNWWWEDGVKPDASMKKAYRACVREFMGYLGAKELSLGEGWRGIRL